MVSYHSMKTETLTAGYCRKCLNTAYGLHLEPDDCYYFCYPSECTCCKKVSHIVVDIRVKSRAKLLKAHRKYIETIDQA